MPRSTSVQLPAFMNSLLYERAWHCSAVIYSLGNFWRLQRAGAEAVLLVLSTVFGAITLAPIFSLRLSDPPI